MRLHRALRNELRSSKRVLTPGDAELIMPEAEPTQLGAELRAQREARGWTQVQLADQLGWSSSFISDVETGYRSCRADFAARCDEVFGQPGTFVRILAHQQRAAYPDFFAPVVPLEREARRIHEWSPSAVPGLLQTSGYARSTIRAGAPADDDATIERKVDGRIERQEILSGDRPPLYTVMIHEGVVRHVVGGPAVMRGQLDHLVKAAESPGVVLQILPFSARDHAGVEGPIVVYESASASTGYTECHGGGRMVEHSDDVADLVTVLTMLRASSLSPADSIDMIRHIRGGLDGLA